MSNFTDHLHVDSQDPIGIRDLLKSGSLAFNEHFSIKTVFRESRKCVEVSFSHPHKDAIVELLEKSTKYEIMNGASSTAPKIVTAEVVPEEAPAPDPTKQLLHSHPRYGIYERQKGDFVKKVVAKTLLNTEYFEILDPVYDDLENTHAEVCFFLKRKDTRLVVTDFLDSNGYEYREENNFIFVEVELVEEVVKPELVVPTEEEWNEMSSHLQSRWFTGVLRSFNLEAKSIRPGKKGTNVLKVLVYATPAEATKAYNTLVGFGFNVEQPTKRGGEMYASVQVRSYLPVARRPDAGKRKTAGTGVELMLEFKEWKDVVTEQLKKELNVYPSEYFFDTVGPKDLQADTFRFLIYSKQLMTVRRIRSFFDANGLSPQKIGLEIGFDMTAEKLTQRNFVSPEYQEVKIIDPFADRPGFRDIDIGANQTSFISYEYEIFKNVSFNRDVSDVHVVKLMREMMRHGILSSCAMVKTNCINEGEEVEIYTADGQHRKEAIRRLEEGVQYYLTSVDDKREFVHLMAGLNVTSKPWDLKQYLRSWSAIDSDSYALLNQQFKETGLPLSALIDALTDLGRQTATEAFKAGNFYVPDPEKGLRHIEYLTDIQGFTPRSRPFMGAMTQLFREEGDQYDHADMVKRLKQLERKFPFELSNEGMLLKQVRKIYTVPELAYLS